ncbi:N-acetylmuramoyl-L-alanine amidase [Persicimonas caeni]|nr:N-acetylmuramoyl-L-alanine amidase [Persicimonas caeni]
MYDDQPLEDYGPEYETRRGELTEFCQVPVEGYGTLSVEDEYLAQVVTCEHEGAPMETLKAQAIAARGYAKYVVDVEQRAVSPTVRDQAYNCGRPATDRARQAVRETSGMVLTHNGKLIMPFYVAGSTNVDSNSCRASGSSGTQRYVTYNEGRIGSGVRPSSLGWSGSPANRGAMSQNGAACLANNGWNAERILRFFYGDDIRVTQLPGSCVDSGTSIDPSNSGSTFDPDEDDGGGASQTCDTTTTAPDIITRSQWGARAPRYNRPRHSPNRFTIHHTVTSNNDTNPMRTVKQVQNYHMDSNGWADIGYHYLVDQQGRIYQGNPVDRRGAHVGGHNTGNIGISFLGNYQSLQPTEEQLASAGQLIRHLSDRYGISPSASNVKGHRDQGSTACPGNHLYAQIERIIRHANGEAETECDEKSGGGGGNTGSPEFRYVRVKAVSPDPLGANDTVEGFELDSVFYERAGAGTTHMAAGVGGSSGATNTGAAVGQPDNTSCDNRSSTVAGIQDGGHIIVQFSEGLRPGDTLHVVQANYNVGLNDCAPSGTAEIAISTDGSNWQVVSSGVSGNAAVQVSPSFVRFVKPQPNSTHEPLVQFEVESSQDIAEVEYFADDYSLGVATQGPNFPHEYEFQNMGVRQLEVRGYDSRGNVLATDQITIEVQGGSGGGTNSAMADELGTEGGTCSGVGNGAGGPRCSDGRGGYSTGQCWAFVKAAMIRAGLATRADINALAARVGMSGYSVQVSAAGFKRAADRASAADLADTMSLRKVDMSVQDAPKGAVIAWAPGCRGFHSRYGHIEIAQGDGYGCSDYCGQLKADASCASVYVPTN